MKTRYYLALAAVLSMVLVGCKKGEEAADAAGGAAGKMAGAATDAAGKAADAAGNAADAAKDAAGAAKDAAGAAKDAAGNAVGAAKDAAGAAAGAAGGAAAGAANAVSDAGTVAKVKNAINLEKEFDRTKNKVDVKSKDGSIILTGDVVDTHTKNVVVRVAKAAAPGKTVVDQLKAAK